MRKHATTTFKSSGVGWVTAAVGVFPAHNCPIQMKYTKTVIDAPLHTRRGASSVTLLPPLTSLTKMLLATPYGGCGAPCILWGVGECWRPRVGRPSVFFSENGRTVQLFVYYSDILLTIYSRTAPYKFTKRNLT